MNQITEQQIKLIKRRANALKKTSGITHIEALNTVVKDYGYENWNQYQKASKTP
jgi:hypothetical protein